MSDQIDQLATALAAAQGEMHNAVMNRTNPHFRSKYADLSSVLDAVRAPLSKHGLAVVQTMVREGSDLILRTTLMHVSGQSIATEYPLPHTQKAHEMGSALTYARRYSLAALICNSSDEDDDGNMAMSSKPTKISRDELDQVRDLALAREADIPKLCQYFKVESLADITPDILPNVIAALNAKKVRSDA